MAFPLSTDLYSCQYDSCNFSPLVFFFLIPSLGSLRWIMSFSIILIMSVQTVGLTGNSVFVVLFFFLFVNSQVLSKRSSLLVSVMCSEWVVKCLCVWKLCTTRMCLVCFAFFSYIFLDRNSNNSSSQHLTLILLLFPKGRLYNRYILHISVPPPPPKLFEQ